MNISDALPARFLFSVGSAKLTGLNPWCCSNLLTASHSLCSCCKSMQHVTITCIITRNLIYKPMHAETSEISAKISASPQFYNLKLTVGPQKHVCFVSGLQRSSQIFSFHLYLFQLHINYELQHYFKQGLPPFLWPDQLCNPPLSIHSRWRELTQIRLLSLLSERTIRNSSTWWKERRLTCSIMIWEPVRKQMRVNIV